jgi:hypothetical protein
MRKLALSIIFVVLFCISSHAQGLYKVVYHADDTRYDAILVWYGVGQPYMRIRFYQPTAKKIVLAQQNVSYNPTGFGTGQLVGNNPIFLTPMPPEYHYYSDNFVFKLLPNGFWACTDLISDNKIYPVLEFRPMMPYEVTNALLTDYGFSNQSTTAATTSTSNVTMHLIVVANLDDRSIGADVDMEGLEREFRAAADAVGIRFSLTRVTGDYFNRTSVLATIDALKPGSNDVVVFVYTGHGFRYDDDTESWPRMALTRNRQTVEGNSVSEGEVYNKLKAKGARLNITIVDSCNSKIGMDKPTYGEGVIMKPSDAGISRKGVETLFLKTRGNVLMAAANKGEKALANKQIGGFFIHSFLNAFMYETSIANTSTPGWESMVKSAQSYTYTKTKGQQNAIYYTDLR